MQCINVDFPEPLGPMIAVKRTPEFDVYFVERSDSGIAITVGFRSIHDASGSGEGLCSGHILQSAFVCGGVQVKSGVQPSSFLWYGDEY